MVGCFFSAFIGCFSHVLLDSIMHYAVQPFGPLMLDNPFLVFISVPLIHKLCLYSGLLGAVIYYSVNWFLKRKKSSNNYF